MNSFVLRTAVRVFMLAWYRAVMGLKSESRVTRLGYLWWFIEPALHLAVYYFAFSVLFNRGGNDYVFYLLVGIVHWLWFAKSIMNASSSIVISKSLIQQLPLHVAMFPLAEILKDAIRQVLVTVILLGTLWLMGGTFGKVLIYYPLVFLVQFFLILVLACGIAALMPFIADLRVIVPACLQLGMFLSGVFFTRDMIPDELQWFLNWNPVYLLLESYRDILIRGQLPDIETLGVMLFVLALASGLIIKLMSFLNRQYAKIL